MKTLNHHPALATLRAANARVIADGAPVFVEIAPNTNAAARWQGFTREVLASSSLCDLHLLIKPETDIGETFRAWDCDAHEWLSVKGWNFDIEPWADVA